MGNPLKDIRVFEIEWTPSKEQGKCFRRIMTTYTRSGAVVAYKGYSDERIGRAGGYGYDKTHTALHDGISTITGKDAPNEGSGGFECVAREWKKLGVKVKSIM